MNIYTTHPEDLFKFQQFFSGHSVKVLPENYKGMNIDLLVFPGGDDVHPKRYGGKIPERSIYKDWIDEERDDREFKIMSDLTSGRFHSTKVIGICRGMQLINVALGGSLIYDIAARFGSPHPNPHNIDWKVKTIFSSVVKVNSIHHQGVYSVGSDLRPLLLARENNTAVPEAILWRNDILGMQFHPEYWGNLDIAKVFSSGILEWVKGRPIVLETHHETPDERQAKVFQWTASSVTYAEKPSLNWFEESAPPEEELEVEEENEEEEDLD